MKGFYGAVHVFFVVVAVLYFLTSLGYWLLWAEGVIADPAKLENAIACRVVGTILLMLAAFISGGIYAAE